MKAMKDLLLELLHNTNVRKTAVNVSKVLNFLKTGTQNKSIKIHFSNTFCC